MKNLRFKNTRVSAVFDWDSLRAAPEAHIVGAAATHYSATWYLEVRKAPSLAEVAAFLVDYETARGRPFSASERSAITATAIYSAGYPSRCEFRSRLNTAGSREGEFQSLLRALAIRCGIDLER